MAQADKTRDNIGTPGVAKNRFEILKEVIARYNKSMKEGYYLEAITLCESLICDRLESRIGELTRRDPPFGMLGPLCTQLQKGLETDAALITIYDNINTLWREKRNKAIHQSAKISKAQPKVWSDFLNDAKKAAKEGMKFFRALDKELKRVR